MEQAKSIENKNGERHILVGSEITVKATAELSRKIQEELFSDKEEIDIEELLDAKKNNGNE